MFKKLLLALFVCALVAANAQAAAPTMDSVVSGITVSTTAVYTVIGVIATALALIWPAKKIIKHLNKS